MKDATASHNAAMGEVRRVVAEAKELNRAADGALTDHLATWIAGRYAMATHQLVPDNGNEGVDWNLLRAMCQDMVALRRGDHSAESLRLERQRLEMERAEKKEDLQRRFLEWAKENREKICQGFITSDQKVEILGRQIFGDMWCDEPPPSQGNGNDGPVGPPPSQGRSSRIKANKAKK